MNRYFSRRLDGSQPENIKEISPIIIQQIVDNLNFFEKLILKIRGSLLIDNLKFEGYSKKIPLYLFKCDFHGYALNYPQGYDMKLICLKCVKKRLEKIPDESKKIYEKYIQ